MEIQNKFQVEDKVKIKISDKIGTISSIAVNDKNGEKVSYFVDYSTTEGKIEGRWFDDFEISAIE